MQAVTLSCDFYHSWIIVFCLIRRLLQISSSVQLCLECDRILDQKCTFLDLLCLTHYLDCSLCIFFHTSLTERSKTHLSMSGPLLWSGCWLTTTPLSSSASLRSQPHSRPRAQPAVLQAHHGHPARAHCRHRAGPASMSVRTNACGLHCPRA